MNPHTEEAVQSGIIRSVRGKVRELIGFIGFQADLTYILDWVEERFGKVPSAVAFQQEFYLCGQVKMEKVQQFASHLGQRYRKLQTKFPGHYERKQLKDQLFFGMHQHLHNYIHFLYKQEETIYEDLLSATHETETEWTESKVSARFKGANVEECRDEGTTELKSKIDSLTVILKSSNFGISRTQEKEKVDQGNTTQKGRQGKSKSTSNIPLKGQGPGTPAAGSSKESQKPI